MTHDIPWHLMTWDDADREGAVKAMALSQGLPMPSCRMVWSTLCPSTPMLWAPCIWRSTTSNSWKSQISPQRVTSFGVRSRLSWVWGWLIGTNSNGFSGRILLHFWLDESCRFLHDPVIFTLPVDYSWLMLTVLGWAMICPCWISMDIYGCVQFQSVSPIFQW